MKTNPGDGQLDQVKPEDGLSASMAIDAVSGYARSLVDLAKVEASLDLVDRDLRLVKETLSGHVDLKKTLVDPDLALGKKQAVLRDLFTAKIDDVTLNYVQFLVGMGQTEIIPDIADEFARQLEIEENKVIAEVTTAAPMNAKFSKSLAARLSEISGRQVAIRADVDPDLVGGVVVRLGGKLLDGSVRNQLARLRGKMLDDMRGK